MSAPAANKYTWDIVSCGSCRSACCRQYKVDGYLWETHGMVSAGEPQQANTYLSWLGLKEVEPTNTLITNFCLSYHNMTLLLFFYETWLTEDDFNKFGPDNIPREFRKCIVYKFTHLQDEYHFVLFVQLIVTLRKSAQKLNFTSFHFLLN